MAAAVAKAAAAQPQPGSEAILKSPLDKREYRRFVLGNGMTALLISDPEMAEAVSSAAAKEDDAHDSERPDKKELNGRADSSADGSSSDGSDGEASSDDDEGNDNAPQQAAKKAAAAMAVGVGSFSDPAEMQGLSHYLEHMLFMGSEKFPDENDYDSFLAHHGGASNAYTDLEITNYQFDCKPTALQPALDRFAQFFLAPLCKEDALQREVSAVDNEFAGVQQSDSCRMAQLRCHTALEGHPFQGFSWGNRTSLWDEPLAAGVPIRDRIVEYYRHQYSAERMSLVVLGGHSLDELQQWVGNSFAGVPTGRGPRPEFSTAGLPFKGGWVYGMPAVKDVHSINITFQLPCLQDAYAAKADEYLAHLVGHEGSGSLLSALKARGWATQLSAGVSEGGHERSTAAWLFDVHIALTDTGRAEGPGGGLACVGLLFQYLEMLRTKGPQQWVFTELRDIAEMKFRFAEEEDACEYVTRLAAEMHQFPPAHCLKGQWVYGAWDPSLVTELLSHMTPEACRIDMQTREYDSLAAKIKQMPDAGEGTEPWFKLPYTCATLTPEILQGWSDAAPVADLALPAANGYLPTDFTLVAAPFSSAAAASADGVSSEGKAVAVQSGGPSAFPEPPALLAEEDGLRLWAKTDTAFGVPRTVACLLLSSPRSDQPERAAALTHLVVKLLEDALCETTYQAEVAGLVCYVSPEGGASLAVRLDGFSHRLPDLAAVVFRTLATLKVEEAAFQRVREALARVYRNSNMRPEAASRYARLFALRHSMVHLKDVLPALEAATASEVQEHLTQLLKTIHVEALLHGNLSAQNAEAVTKAATTALPGGPMPAGSRHVDRVIRIPVGASLYREGPNNPEEENSVCEVYLQCGPDSASERALVDLLEQVASEPAYDTLRSKQQLGYSVHASTRMTHGTLAFCVVVASGTHGPVALEQRIEAFLEGFASALAEMPAGEFERNRSSLLAAKLQKDVALADEADRHWEAISSGRYNFDARAEEVEALGALTQRDLAAWYADTLAPAGASRRKLTIHVAGKSQLEDLKATPSSLHGAVHVIEDLTAWKADKSRQLSDMPTSKLPKAAEK